MARAMAGPFTRGSPDHAAVAGKFSRTSLEIPCRRRRDGAGGDGDGGDRVDDGPDH